MWSILLAPILSNRPSNWTFLGSKRRVMPPKTTLARYKNQAQQPKQQQAIVQAISEFCQILRHVAPPVYFLPKIMWLVLALAPPLNPLVKGVRRRSLRNRAHQSNTPQRLCQAKSSRGNQRPHWLKRRLDLELWGHRRKDSELQDRVRSVVDNFRKEPPVNKIIPNLLSRIPN